MATTSEVNKGCRQVDEFLVRGGSAELGALPEAVAEHRAVCARCRRLFSWFDADPPEPERAPDTAGIRERMQEELRPVTPLPSNRVLAMRFVVALLLMSLGLASLTGSGAAAQLNWLQAGVLVFLLSAGAVAVALLLTWQMVPGAGQPFSAGPAILVFLGAFGLGAALLFPMGTTERFVQLGWQCGRSGAVMAAPAALLLWLLVRRGAVVSPGRAGATIGGAAGLVGLTAVQWGCDRQEALHIGLWHAAIVVICLAAGLALGRLAEWRPQGEGMRSRA